MSTGRNDPCPCGSGEKYKRCCLAKGDAKQASRLRLLTFSTLAVLALTLILGLAHSVEAGLTVAALGLAGIGLWLWLFAPPPRASAGSDPSSINYGR